MGIKSIHAITATFVVAALALTATACGSDDSSTTTGGGGSTATTAGGGADVAAAKAQLAPFVGKPSPFPVDEPLKKAIPAGTKLVYMQCASPICQLQWPIFEAAGKALGAQVSRIKTGASAQEVATAFDTAVAQKPDGVFIPAMEPSLFTKQVKQLNDQGAVVASSGIVDPEAAGIKVFTLSRPTIELTGRLLAAEAVVQKGDEADIAYYEVPELSFVGTQKQAFHDELAKLCSACKVRDVKVPLSAVGSTAPSLIVSDLQKNPDTNIAVYSTQEMSIGVPAALKSAGIDGLVTYGFGPTPANLQYIKAGQETGSLALDIPVNVWTVADVIARTMVGQPLTKAEATQDPPTPDLQYLSQGDITFDPAKGWTGYPDYAERFAKLWTPAG